MSKNDDSDTPSCMVCMEPFTNKKKAVVCPKCDNQADDDDNDTMRACTECTKRYLLDNKNAAHCMNCKHPWNFFFLHKNFTKTWITGIYRKSRQELALDREKSMLTQALPYLEETKRKRDITNQIRELYAREKELRQEIINIRKMQRDLRILYDNPEAEIGPDATVTNKKSYMFPCPAEGCRGFIESLSWSCGICDTKVCKSCHIKREVITEGKNKGKLKQHTCKKEDIESAKEIMKSTRSCPSCHTRIFRSEGCQQMFCTNCNTAFDWVKGNIITGNIHNPHYFELQQKMGGAVLRNIRDVPCGNMSTNFIAWLQSGYRTKFTNYMGRIGEINDRITTLAEKDNMDLRVAFLLKTIPSEHDFKRAIFLRERQNEKKREERQILETFRVAVIERFNDLEALFEPTISFGTLYASLIGTSCKEDKQFTKMMQDNIKQVDIKLKELDEIMRFCNKAFNETWTALGYKAIPKIYLDCHYGSVPQVEADYNEGEDSDDENYEN